LLGLIQAVARMRPLPGLHQSTFFRLGLPDDLVTV
jgi:hypothetical protein